MLTFPLHFTAQVHIQDSIIRLSIVVSEAAMPPRRESPNSQSARALASAAARTVMRRHFPDQAHSIVVPYPVLMDHPVPAGTTSHTIWDDAGVVVSLLEDAPVDLVR
jgi:hypothetical protein